MWRGARIQGSLPIVFVAFLCLQSPVYGRVLHQYGGSTAAQLVSDGSDNSTPQTSGGGSAAAAPSIDTGASTDEAQPPAQQIRLRWANQVDALPPAYQAAGAGVLNDILGPSGEPTDTDGQDAPSIQPWYNSPSDGAPPPSYAASPEAVAAAPAASPPSPSLTPVPTMAAAPPVIVTAPAAIALPAVVVLAPAPGPEAEQPLVPLLGGAAPLQAPDAAPAPAPTQNIDCSDSGSNNQMGLTVCQFMTGLLPKSTQTRMCSRYLPRCPAPVEAPVASAAMTPAPAPAQADAAVPVAASSGSTTSDAGSLLQPLLSGLESIFGGSQSADGNSSGSGLAGMLG